MEEAQVAFLIVMTLAAAWVGWAVSGPMAAWW